MPFTSLRYTVNHSFKFWACKHSGRFFYYIFMQGHLYGLKFKVPIVCRYMTRKKVVSSPYAASLEVKLNFYMQVVLLVRFQCLEFQCLCLEFRISIT